MVNYRLIIEYHQKGNNNTQVATLCSCSRMTVWKVVNRIVDIEIPTDELLKLDNEKLKNIIFPEYMKKGEGFLIPDFKWEEFQMRKHQSSLRLCGRRYCKRALKQNLKAYSWASFVFFYSRDCLYPGCGNNSMMRYLRRLSTYRRIYAFKYDNLHGWHETKTIKF